MKKIAQFLLAVLIFFAAVFIARNAIVKAVIETGVKAVTGLPLKLGKLDVNFPGHFVIVENLKLYNPAGFPDEPMVDLPEIYVHYDLAAIMAGKIHLQELRFSLEEFVVVRNQDGALNLDTLKSLADKQPKPSEPVPAKSAGKIEMRIDEFHLHIGRVLFKDYSGGTPSVKKFEVGINEVFKDITNPDALVRVVVAKALMNTSIASLTNFDLAGLQGSVSGVLNSSVQEAQKLVGETLLQVTQSAGDLQDLAGSPQDLVKGVTKTGDAVVGSAEETAKQAANLLKSKTSGFAGGFAGKLKAVADKATS